MRVVGDFNKLSEETKKKIKPLGKTEKAVYRLLDGVFDIVDGEVKHGSMDEIVCRDTIYDEGTGQPVVIGVPKIIVDGEVTRVEKFKLGGMENILIGDMFQLQGGNHKHREFYEFFELSNLNKSNPDRDQSVRPKFERVDFIAEAAQEEADIDTLTKALIEVSQMSAAKIREFAAGKNWNLNQRPEVLRSKVKAYAKEKPEDFIGSLNDPDNATKTTLKQAFDAGIIAYVPHENKVLWAADSKTLAILDKPQDGESEIELLMAWLRASKNGDNIIKSIQSKVKSLSSK